MCLIGFGTGWQLGARKMVMGLSAEAGKMTTVNGSLKGGGETIFGDWSGGDPFLWY